MCCYFKVAAGTEFTMLSTQYSITSDSPHLVIKLIMPSHAQCAISNLAAHRDVFRKLRHLLRYRLMRFAGRVVVAGNVLVFFNTRN